MKAALGGRLWPFAGTPLEKGRLWEVESEQALRVLVGHQGRVLSVSFSPNGRHLASSADDNTIRLWDCNTGACLAILVPGAEGWAALTPDGCYKLGGVLNGEVWHAINLCRFELGELDPYLPASLRLPDDYRFLTLVPKSATGAAMPSKTPPEPPRRPNRSHVVALLATAAALLLLVTLARC